MNRSVVNVAAQNGVDSKLFRVAHNRLLEFADEIDRVLHALLCVSAQRPVTEAESAANEVDRRIERKKELVAGVAEIREPLRILHDRVELVTMNDEDASAIRRDMNRALLNGNISVSAGKRGNELVVIARNINHRHALARFPQNFLDHVVVHLWPVTTAAQLPDVDQIADDVEFPAIVIAQELQKRFRVARPCSEMDVGNPGGANTPCCLRVSWRLFK